MVKLMKEKEIFQVKEISFKKIRIPDEAFLFFLDVVMEFCYRLNKISFSCISLRSNSFFEFRYFHFYSKN